MNIDVKHFLKIFITESALFRRIAVLYSFPYILKFKKDRQC